MIHASNGAVDCAWRVLDDALPALLSALASLLLLEQLPEEAAPVVGGFSLTQRVGAPGYTISGAAPSHVNGNYTPAKLPNYVGAQAYVKGDLAIFRWAKQHWAISDLGPDPTAAGRFAEDRWIYKVPSSADTPPLAGWAAAAAAC